MNVAMLVLIQVVFCVYDDDGSLDSPRTVHGHDDDAPMTPTGEACDILVALQLSREVEGIFASVVLMFVSSPMDPISPVSKDGKDDDASSSTPLMSSPGSEASFVSSSISAAVPKPSLAKRNTCGTIYLGLTLSAPDKVALIKCVCGVFHAHMLMGAELRGGGGAVISATTPFTPTPNPMNPPLPRPSGMTTPNTPYSTIGALLGTTDSLKLLRPLDVGGPSILLEVTAPATDGGGELNAAACVTKLLMMQRSKTHGCAYSSDKNGGMSSQGSPMLNRVNLELIV